MKFIETLLQSLIQGNKRKVSCVSKNMRLVLVEVGRPPARRVLFLDFDGVLHPGESGTFRYAVQLESILRHNPAVDVAITSNWLERMPFRERIEPFAEDIAKRAEIDLDMIREWVCREVAAVAPKTRREETMNLHKLPLAIGILIMAVIVLAGGWICIPLALLFGLPWIFVYRRGNAGVTGGAPATFPPTGMKSAENARKVANDQLLSPQYSFLPQNVYHHQRNTTHHR